MGEAQSSKPAGPVLAAVGFDQQTPSVVRTALSLARAFGLETRFLHVVEPLVYEPLVFDPVGPYTYPPLAELRAGSGMPLAERRMRELLKSLKDGPRASGAVLSGTAPQSIITDALAHRCGFILTACNPGSYGVASAGVSTALGLMHQAPLPVLAVHGEATPAFERPGFRILIADDLLESTREAVRKGYELAARLRSAHIRHVHVHMSMRAAVRETWRHFKMQRPDAEHWELDEAVWGRDYEARMLTLEDRAAPFRPGAEKAEATIELRVLEGDVGERLRQAAAELKPDLIVFGRHRLLHLRPFLTGRMPCRSMLHGEQAVLLVPPTRELHVQAPFPGGTHYGGWGLGHSQDTLPRMPRL